MSITQKKRLIFRSLDEFRRTYLPRYHQPRIVETPEDARLLGINIVTKSMDKIDLKVGVSKVNTPT
jgi:hypothetical protein